MASLPVEELPLDELVRIAPDARDCLHDAAVRAEQHTQRQTQERTLRRQQLQQHGVDCAKRELRDVDDLDVLASWRIEQSVSRELAEIVGDESTAEIEDWVDDILEDNGTRRTDIGAAGCTGLSITMRQLDDIVTDAVCDKVLEPSRLVTMVGALIARNARHQDRQRAEMRDLFAKHREINTQLKNLIDIMEKGGLGSGHSVQERFAARQTELDEINRLIALKKRALETPITKVTAEKAEAFATAFRAHLRGQESPTFRRAYLRLMLDKVVVGKDAIRISGPKSSSVKNPQVIEAGI